MARGDFLRRRCKAILQSDVVPKLTVPRSIRGTRWKIEKRGRYAKQRRNRNRRAMDTLTLRPGAALWRERRIMRHAVGPGVSLQTETAQDLSELVADPEDLFALLNLCRNASAPPQDGDEIVILAKNGVPRAGASTGTVEFIVADNGKRHGGRSASASVRLQFHDEASWARFGSRSRPGAAICPRERRRC